ncbi:ANTAR domain-containing response regulator [Bacillus badius]|uniref:Ethanolamine two-component response regulator n=1 Tax=Bacillus badius TaxID=1455 RepID=A0ABR5AVA8_BACBA|nr:response regulator [Bacillus badius]KIL76462.1 Ethanolamine two-component response regulator [Bacillus badius]KIL78579.1 Ethanolamine two-component response regulator [Bacillus badius]KZR58661.1 Fis family transcriptional regulator [Bacillus badius]MED4715998.1 response regulator [Bacillus badius]
MGQRILLVEDESLIRLDISSILQDNGYEVVGEAGDGEKAVELAFALKPDLIIMDIKMPKLNGLKAGKIISDKLDIPIILVTAYSQKEFVEKSKQANVVGYLVKPVSEANLLPAVEVALNQAAKMRTMQDAVAAANEQVEKRKLIERAKGLLMKHLSVSEEEAYQRMRKFSMKHRLSMNETAEKVIAKYK